MATIVDVNAWFDRLREAAQAELGEDPSVGEALTLRPSEARDLLELAREVAHGSGARQFAPLATYLAGRLSATRGGDVASLVAVLTRAAGRAGPAGEDATGRG